MTYLIYSNKHSRGVSTWWGPDQRGYYQNLNKAGHYTEQEARRICAALHGDATPVPLQAVLGEMHKRLIVDEGDPGNWQVIQRYIDAAKSPALTVINSKGGV